MTKIELSLGSEWARNEKLVHAAKTDHEKQIKKLKIVRQSLLQHGIVAKINFVRDIYFFTALIIMHPINEVSAMVKNFSSMWMIFM